MQTKREFVKQYVLEQEFEFVTVNTVLYSMTGVWGGVRWHSAILKVSHSTVRRALDELVSEGKMTSYYKYGDCYDELRFEKILSHSVDKK